MLSKVSSEMIESFLSKNNINTQPRALRATVALAGEMSETQRELLNEMTLSIESLYGRENEENKMKALLIGVMTWKLLLQADEVEELENQL